MQPAWAGKLLPAPAQHDAKEQLMLRHGLIHSSEVTDGHYARPANRMRLVFSATVIFFAADSFGETIRLGGPRNIVVDVKDERDGFSIIVEMLPVKCFNAATNARLNRSKACFYGLAGLGRSLGVDAADLNLRHDIAAIQVIDVRPDDARYRLRFFLPEHAIRVSQPQKAASKSLGVVDASTCFDRNRSQLFTCVEDYAMTIEQLKDTYNERLSDRMTNAVGTFTSIGIDEQLDSARLAIAEVEAEAKASFEATKREFGQDLRVLALEKRSLATLLEATLAEFDASKQKADAALEAAALGAAKQRPPAAPTANAHESEVAQ
jgi:hypothetical protein